MADLIEYSLDLKGISKKFSRSRKRGNYSTLKSIFLSAKKREQEELIHEALQSITIRVPKGASVGIIGRNGAGKSTLLKVITGIYKADEGSVSVNGRVSALIELGAGFHPDFTGRENVFLSAAMQGMTKKEIEERFDKIVAFAELEDVIDEPVRTYSSGMFMRLGFSVAVHTDPEVLIIDEVLAVGDAGFVAKCKEKISELKRKGVTLLLVAHDLEAVERWSDEIIWIEHGAIKDRGEPARVIDAYRMFIEKRENDALIDAEMRHDVSPLVPQAEARWGSREIEITKVDMLGAEGISVRAFHPQEPVTIQIHFKRNTLVHQPVVFGVGITRSDGVLAFGTNTDIERVECGDLKSEGVIRCILKGISLSEGSFSLDVAVHAQDGYPYDYRKEVIHFIVRSPKKRVGVTDMLTEWLVM